MVYLQSDSVNDTVFGCWKYIVFHLVDTECFSCEHLRKQIRRLQFEIILEWIQANGTSQLRPSFELDELDGLCTKSLILCATSVSSLWVFFTNDP